MMGMMKNKKGLLSPSSLAIHVIGISAAIWLGKAWERKNDDF